MRGPVWPLWGKGLGVGRLLPMGPVATYTGARVGELTQLRAGDVHARKGLADSIWVLRLTDAGAIKTGRPRESARSCPPGLPRVRKACLGRVGSGMRRRSTAGYPESRAATPNTAERHAVDDRLDDYSAPGLCPRRRCSYAQGGQPSERRACHLCIAISGASTKLAERPEGKRLFNMRQACEFVSARSGGRFDSRVRLHNAFGWGGPATQLLNACACRRINHNGARL
jgi:hypothetical protein